MNWLKLAGVVVGAVQKVEETYKEEKGGKKKSEAIIAIDRALPCRGTQRLIDARSKLVDSIVEFENAAAEAKDENPISISTITNSH